MIKHVLFPLLLLFLGSGLTLSVSEPQSASLLPHAAESFNISYIQVTLLLLNPIAKKLETLLNFSYFSSYMHNMKAKTKFLFFIFVGFCIAEERRELFLHGVYIN